MLQTAFDPIAESYDDNFTHSLIGRSQRSQVMRLLWPSLLHFTDPLILEVNCGTGEDAVALAKRGYTVIATDISPEMISATKKKVAKLGLQDKIVAQVLDVNSLDLLNPSAAFDLIFSNFGGLNCINATQYERFVEQASRLLSENGKLVIVVMAKYCLWEILYFLVKKNRNFLRRFAPSEGLAKLGDKSFPVWYPSAETCRKISESHFRLKRVRPIGLFVPPSYLENFFQKHPGLFRLLEYADQKTGHCSSLGNFGDHVYLEFDKIK